MPDQIDRLLRQKWKDPHALAMEMYAILNSDTPLKITSPVQLEPSTSGPAFTITLGPDNPPLQVSRGDEGVRMNLTPDAGITFDDTSTGTPTAPTFTDFANPDPTQSAGSNSGLAKNNPSGGGNAFVGQVVSGTGDTYEVNIYPNGLAGNPKSVSVTQLQIDPAETIAAGTYCVVVKAGSTYYMQVTVWA